MPAHSPYGRCKFLIISIYHRLLWYLSILRVSYNLAGHVGFEPTPMVLETSMLPLTPMTCIFKCFNWNRTSTSPKLRSAGCSTIKLLSAFAVRTGFEPVTHRSTIYYSTTELTYYFAALEEFESSFLKSDSLNLAHPVELIGPKILERYRVIETPSKPWQGLIIPLY